LASFQSNCWNLFQQKSSGCLKWLPLKWIKQRNLPVFEGEDVDKPAFQSKQEKKDRPYHQLMVTLPQG
jgi:hypothetical protein